MSTPHQLAVAEENLRQWRARLATAPAEDRPAVAMQVRRAERIVAALQAEADQLLKSVS